MKVIIKKTGELKEVADGHARNYLLPRGLAVPATPEAISQYEATQQDRVKMQDSQRAGQSALRDQLLSLPQTIITAQANKEGTLFAALHASDINKALAEQHSIVLSEDAITLEPIKTLGSHSASITLPGQDPVTITITIIATT